MKESKPYITLQPLFTQSVDRKGEIFPGVGDGGGRNKIPEGQNRPLFSAILEDKFSLGGGWGTTA